jgi:hypothetical protein
MFRKRDCGCWGLSKNGVEWNRFMGQFLAERFFQGVVALEVRAGCFEMSENTLGKWQPTDSRAAIRHNKHDRRQKKRLCRSSEGSL